MSFLVLDASFLVRLLLAESEETPAVQHYREWKAKELEMALPSLALYEAANALYRYARAGETTLGEAQTLWRQALRLGFRYFQEPWIHTRALELGHELGLGAVYDAHYLALAEGLAAPFWTADRRLYQKALEGQAKGLLPGVSLHLLGP
ncbi:type II toxin-antitoxin system VapC family toxin [Thermus caldilimi]|uniref:type II toxin-antitoxin system VapC family toxin n=1 Tax=Thermus caldilimi TaxID=2483360 RepID=UPI00107673D8|nr:type II toxin-antitoxin system VapC family toxin [Thermus caldilimi]